MAMISWPFDSTVSNDGYGNPVYSRAYSSDVLARILRKYFRDGVFSTPEDCLRVVAASGLSVDVSAGDCLIQGRHGYNEALFNIPLDTANATLPRIDLIVLRLDLSVSGLSITPQKRTGTPAASPAAPSVVRNSTVYELAISEVRVNAAATAITQANITDTRLDSTRCGVVASILGNTDTSTYYAQIAADLAEFKAGREAEFDAWFAAIVNQLGENVATNLYNLISKYKAKNAAITLAVADWTGSGPYTQTKSVSIVPANCTLHSGPAESSRAVYVDADVHVSSASSGSVTFTAKKIPSAELTVNLSVSEVDA